MMEYTIINSGTGENAQFTNDRVADFLFDHLEQYGDERKDIMKCIEYVFNKGGFITVGHERGEIKGVVIMNETGMSDYIPENILVYIAVDRSTRGQGFGRQLMQKAMDEAEGDIALHVEPDNPAKFLYEKLGFTNKYLEMRYKKK